MKRVKFLALLALVVVAGISTSCKEENRGDGPKEPVIVTIAGIKWTTANLMAAAGATSGHRVGNPQDYGSYFKWGSNYTYDNTNVGEGWSEHTTGAATNPTASLTDGLGYDYVGLSGGTAHPGDPCQKLGGSYRTPTRAQWQALNSSGSLWGTHNGIAGCFFGPKAAQCNNTTIEEGCIFLPASGYRSWHDGSQYNQGSWGHYWSSSVGDSNSGYICYFGSSSVHPDSASVRCNGFSVRCVQE